MRGNAVTEVRGGSTPFQTCSIRHCYVFWETRTHPCVGVANGCHDAVSIDPQLVWVLFLHLKEKQRQQSPLGWERQKFGVVMVWVCPLASCHLLLVRSDP